MDSPQLSAEPVSLVLPPWHQVTDSVWTIFIFYIFILYLYFKNEQDDLHVSTILLTKEEEFKIHSTMPGACWRSCSVHLYALFGSLFLDSI